MLFFCKIRNKVILNLNIFKFIKYQALVFAFLIFRLNLNTSFLRIEKKRHKTITIVR